jgi:hypothetical protein
MGAQIGFNNDTKRIVSFSCQCVDFNDGGKPTIDCNTCNGSGSVSFTEDEHSVHWSYSSVYRVFEFLGLDPNTDDYGTVGDIDATDLWNRCLDSLDACAHDEDMWDRVNALLVIALHAARKNERVCWA